MKLIFYIPICLLMFGLNAQNIQGVVTYSTKTKIDLEIQGTDMPESIKESLKASMKQMSERNYNLHFDGNTSLFLEEESLSPPSISNANSPISIKVGTSKTVLYKNIAEQQLIREEDMFGKPFLVKDSLRTFNWKLRNESKKIGNYSCFKAIGTMEVQNRNVKIVFESDSNEEKEKEKDPITMKTIEVVAWFTPEIPIANGPENFGGLPGLILELSAENTTYLCSQIVLNPKNPKAIVAPTKGKVVTFAAYEEILRKKLKEMEMQFGGKNRSGNIFINH